jgi:hypothetical protein
MAYFYCGKFRELTRHIRRIYFYREMMHLRRIRARRGLDKKISFWECGGYIVSGVVAGRGKCFHQPIHLTSSESASRCRQGRDATMGNRRTRHVEIAKAAHHRPAICFVLNTILDRFDVVAGARGQAAIEIAINTPGTRSSGTTTAPARRVGFGCI